MKKTLMALACLMVSTAWADDCRFELQFERTLDLTGADQLKVLAVAGDLEIIGDGDSKQAFIQAFICTADESWADENRLRTSSGKTAEIAVKPPASDMRSAWGGKGNFSMDLTVRIPEGMALSVTDSSGPLTVSGSGDLSIRDSSGGMVISDIQGMVNVEDSSGDIEMFRVGGDLVVEGDTSGNITGTDIRGSVLVKNDSSGNIHFEEVQDDFIVEQDSSGHIIADTIGGDFRVLKDGSGSVKATNVSGEIEIPEKG